MTRIAILALIAATLVGTITYTYTKASANKVTVVTQTQPVVTQAAITPSLTAVVNSPVAQKDPAIVTKDIPVQRISTSGRNVVIFNTPVVGDSVDMAISLLNNTSGDTVYLVLDSPGGSVIDGARLINYIKYSGKNIITVCDNLCASMAFQIFQVGKKRLMTDKAILMAHPASGGAGGIIENIYELIKTIKLYVDRMDAETAKRAGMSYEKFKMLVFNNIWAETPEALALGLADGVVYLNTSGFMNSNPEDVLTNLKRTGKFKEDMMKVRGYVFSVQ